MKKKTISVLLIDPSTQTITPIEIEKGIEAIYKAMDCEIFECPIEYANGDVLYCDEEHKLNRSKLIGGFTYPNAWNDVIMNKALVIGTSPNGDSTNCKSKPSDIQNMDGGIQWYDKASCESVLQFMGF